MRVADARVICAVWGCARCLWFVCVCLFASRCVSGRAWSLCVLQCGVHSRPSVLLLFTSVCSPVCEWYHPSLELPHTLCTYVVYPRFICLRFFIAFCIPCISCIFYI